jgi:hypothetical protein
VAKNKLKKLREYPVASAGLAEEGLIVVVSSGGSRARGQH